MLETEFNEKYPNIDWDVTLEESYAGYPVIQVTVSMLPSVEFIVYSHNVESCLDIVDTTIQKLNEIDFSKNEEYLSRAHKAYKEFFELQKRNEELRAEHKEKMKKQQEEGE